LNKCGKSFNTFATTVFVAVAVTASIPVDSWRQRALYAYRRLYKSLDFHIRWILQQFLKHLPNSSKNIPYRSPAHILFAFSASASTCQFVCFSYGNCASVCMCVCVCVCVWVWRVHINFIYTAYADVVAVALFIRVSSFYVYLNFLVG